MSHQQQQERTAGGKRPLPGPYCANHPEDVLTVERRLARKVGGILGYTGGANRAGFDGSVAWAVGLWGKIDRRVFSSVPLISKGATLEEEALGDHNAHCRKAAEHLRGFRPGDDNRGLSMCALPRTLGAIAHLSPAIPLRERSGRLPD